MAEVNLEQEALKKKVAKFAEEVGKLEKLHGLKIIAVLDRTMFGTVAKLEFMDYKEFESMFAK